MQLTRSSVSVCTSNADLSRVSAWRAAFSLHNHSSCSRETLDFLPDIARGIPLVAWLFEARLRKYARLHGRPLDFDRAYWRPPLDAAALLACEERSIRDRLQVTPLVAITDHDTIEGPVHLRARSIAAPPVSVEWTVHYGRAEFHLGVHNLPPTVAGEVIAALNAHTQRPTVDGLPALLSWICEAPTAFVVLNHPLWDLAEVGQVRHESALLALLRTHGRFIHALELNGYRRWSENRRVVPIAEGFGLPLVGGGDRHGLTPSTMLNVSDATSWDEFASDLRDGASTSTVVLPEYFEPFAARILQGVRDVLHHTVPSASGPAPWVDRVFYLDHGVERSLGSVWPRGGPLWLRLLVRLTRLLGSRTMRPVYRLALTSELALP
jgi:hypothetical protein